MYTLEFSEVRPDVSIVRNAVGQFPYGHNVVLLTRLKDLQ